MYRYRFTTLLYFFYLLLIATFCGCGEKDEKTTLTLDSATAGASQGKPIESYTLTNRQGMEVAITNYGAKVVRIITPDKTGQMADIVLGYDDLPSYIKGNPYFGACVGRYANRIAGGQFYLDGQLYHLSRNNGNNALHGGPGGFHNVVWDAKKITAASGQALELTYLSRDGEEGYPGNLKARIVYTLTDSNALKIDFYAETDKTTIVNMAHHSFFNLAGEGKEDILGHRLKINAKYYTPVNEALIPTGEIVPVSGTPFDFTAFTAIGARINHRNEQLEYGRGYDHNFVLDREDKSLLLAATVYEPKSGRSLEVWTKEPGLQFYSGNFLDGSDMGKGGKPYHYRSAFCLETQHFPNSPNQPNFPSCVLQPNEKYHHEVVYKFGVRK